MPAGELAADGMEARLGHTERMLKGDARKGRAMRSGIVASVVTLLLLALSAKMALAEGQQEENWTAPGAAFEPEIARTFIRNDFVVEGVARDYPENTVLAYASEACPDGWQQLIDQEDGAPLFYAFGLLVDANGSPRSRYVRVPACVRQGQDDER